MLLRLGFLASNNGSAMRAIVDAIEKKELRAEASLLVSNKSDNGAVSFAHKSAIFTQIIPTLPDMEAADRAICHAFTLAKVDLVILSGYLRKLGVYTLEAFAGRILNTHPALLPKFGGRGMYGRHVHKAVLAAGETETGATIHLVDGEYDHGGIIARNVVQISKNMDIEAVEKLVIAAENSLFLETLKRIETGELKFW